MAAKQKHEKNSIIFPKIMTKNDKSCYKNYKKNEVFMSNVINQKYWKAGGNDLFINSNINDIDSQIEQYYKLISTFYQIYEFRNK